MTTEQQDEEQREVAATKRLLTGIIVIVILLFGSLAAFGGDVQIVWDETASPVSADRKAKAEAVRSLVDWLVVSNNMPPGQDVLTYRVRPAHLGSTGPLAWTTTGSYVFNDIGKVIVDPGYRVWIDLNLDTGCLTWPDLYFQAVLFHEMFHGLGFDNACFYFNGCVGGTPFAPDNRYIGAAINVFRQEYDPLALFVPMDGAHFAESFDPAEIMTPGLSNSGILNVYVSRTMLAVVQDNGWTVRSGFNGGLLRDLLPTRRLRDEDPIITP